MIRGLYLIGCQDDWHEVLDIRKKVYASEYGIEVEEDEEDAMAMQVILYDGQEKPIGSCRMIFDLDGAYQFDYLAVLPEERKNGYADFIMHMLFDKAKMCGAVSLESKELGHYQDYFKRYGFELKEDKISLDLNRYFNTHKCCH